MKTTLLYVLHVTTPFARRPFWRRVLVPADAVLARLSQVIQAVLGAADPGQHFFVDKRKAIYGGPLDYPSPVKSSRRTRLGWVLRRPGERLIHYCGNDEGWEHGVELREVRRSAARPRRADCLAGRGRFERSAVNRALGKIRV